MMKTTLMNIVAFLALAISALCWGTESADIDRQLAKCEREGGACFEKMEASAIASQKANVSRAGTKLSIRTKANNVYYQDLPDADTKTMMHSYAGFLNKINYYVIFRRSWEGGRFILISDASGVNTQMSAVPYPSPSLKLMVSVSASEAEDTNEIDVWAVTPERLKQIFHYAPSEYALYKFLAWDGENTIRLENFTRSDGKYCPKGKLMTIAETLKLENGKWHLSVDTPVNAKCQ